MLLQLHIFKHYTSNIILYILFCNLHCLSTQFVKLVDICSSNLSLFLCTKVFPCKNTSQLIYPFSYLWTLRLFPNSCYYEQRCCDLASRIHQYITQSSFLSLHIVAELLGYVVCISSTWLDLSNDSWKWMFHSHQRYLRVLSVAHPHRRLICQPCKLLSVW